MKLSPETHTIVGQVGKTICKLSIMKLTPLQVMILIEARYAEARLTKGKHLLISDIQSRIDEMHEEYGDPKPSRQTFWNAVNGLGSRRLVYIAPPRKGTNKRAIALTAKGDMPFTYPKSINPFQLNLTTPTL